MRQLGGRVAVVTGAAGGIGRAISRALAQRGCELALVDRDAAGLRGRSPTSNGREARRPCT